MSIGHAGLARRLAGMTDTTLGITRMHLAGTSQYQHEIARAGLGRGWLHRRPIYCELVPEPYNQHDPHAVRVSALVGKSQRRVTVGYLARETAKRWQQRVIDANNDGHRVVVPMKIIGGTRRKPTRGVFIGTSA